jgi:hypothetical protein
MTLAHTHTHTQCICVCISAWTCIEREDYIKKFSIQIRGNVEECLFFLYGSQPINSSGRDDCVYRQ